MSWLAGVSKPLQAARGSPPPPSQSFNSPFSKLDPAITSQRKHHSLQSLTNCGLVLCTLVDNIEKPCLHKLFFGLREATWKSLKLLLWWYTLLPEIASLPSSLPMCGNEGHQQICSSLSPNKSICVPIPPPLPSPPPILPPLPSSALTSTILHFILFKDFIC